MRRVILFVGSAALAALVAATGLSLADSINLGAATVKLLGATSGSVTLAVPATAGSNTLTFPAGTTDFSATGGTSQVVKQASAGAALTVGRLACADLSDATACNSAAGQLPATATNDNASSGKLGEYISSTVLVGSAVSLTSATPADVTSISLTAGDWDVCGNIAFNEGGTTTTTDTRGAISTVSATLPTIPGAGTFFVSNGTGTTGKGPVFPVGCVRELLSATTTIYLVAQSTFATSTNAAYGFIGARRAR